MIFMRKFICSAFLLFISILAFSQVKENADDGKKLNKVNMEIHDYLPEIHGTIRGKYEYQIDENESRFQVRNARFSLSGNVHPMVAYKAEIDLSDEGVIKMLDAYVRVFPLKAFNFSIGQMRVPFTIDAHRAPHQQYFANRSFIAKQVGNVRDVGLTAAYQIDKGGTYLFEGGLFNGSGVTNQQEWHKALNYSLKAQLFPTKQCNLTLSTQMIKPEDVAIHLYDVGLYYQSQNWHIEGEYLYKSYRNGAFQGVHAVNSFINYDLLLKKVFNKMSFLARYDMMTDHSSGIADKQGQLIVDDHARHRVTGGLTFSFTKAFIADIRLNVEKYFYKKAVAPKTSEDSKIVLEFVTRF